MVLVLVLSIPFTTISAQTRNLNQLLSKSLAYRTVQDSGIYYAARAMALAKELDSEHGQVLSEIYAGVCYFNRGEIDTARALLLKAHTLPEKYQFEWGLLYWYSGKIHLKTGSIEFADKLFRKAEINFGEADSILFKAKAHSSRGIAQGMLGNYNVAFEYFTNAYEAKISLGLAHSASEELNNIGIVYRRLGNVEKAKEYTLLSMQEKDSNKFHTGYIGLGNIYKFANQLDSSLFYYKMALKNARNYDDPETIAITLFNIGNLFFMQKEFEKALQYQQESLAIRESHKYETDAVLSEIGKTHLNMEEYDSAFIYLHKAYSSAKSRGVKVWLRSITEQLSFGYAEQKEYDSAWYYLDLSRAYSDSLKGEEVQKIFSDQRVRLETIEQQNEIQVLHAENNLFQYKRKAMIKSILASTFLLIILFVCYRKSNLRKQSLLFSEKEKLEQELEKNRGLLSSHTLNMIHRKNGLEEIEALLSDVEGSGKHKIKRVINQNKAQEKDWDNFSNYFSQVHTNFFESLKQQFPELSQNDVRICSLIKMSLSNKEIASLLNIEASSVKMSRYRLRKKLQLPDEIELNTFLRELT